MPCIASWQEAEGGSEEQTAVLTALGFQVPGKEPRDFDDRLWFLHCLSMFITLRNSSEQSTSGGCQRGN